MPTPSFPKYGHNALRPNPETADPDAAFPFGQEGILVGHFGSWSASARVTNGLPAESAPKPGALGRVPEREESVRTAKTLRRPLATGA